MSTEEVDGYLTGIEEPKRAQTPAPGSVETAPSGQVGARGWMTRWRSPQVCGDGLVDQR
jgi:hypothetical protein